MKVNINNQSVIEEHDANYGHPGQMQPQMAQMNQVLFSKQELAQSREQNKRKVVGASNIRTLIKSAATRH